MQRILKTLAVAFASLGLALGSASALAQKAETPKDSAKKTETAAPKVETRKAETKADAKPAGALIDINSASEKELASLDGIGEVRAKAIVKNRPYKGKNELKDRKIIPESVYNGIQDKIIAKQDTAAAKKDEKPAAKKDEKKKQ